MSDVLEGERRTSTKAILEALIGSQGRAGLISKETIATALGVSESTVSRWARGDGVPDDDAYRRLRWLRSQRRTWYLRSCPFVLAMWSPLRRAEDDADDVEGTEVEDEEMLDESRYFSEVTFRPTDNPSIVECELKLAATFRAFALVVLGPHRHEVELALTPDGQGNRTLHFDRRLRSAPRQARPSLKKGSRVTLFLRWLV